MPGDIITTEVYAKYLDTNTNNWNAALANLINAIAAGTAPAGTSIDGGATGSIGGGAFPFAGVLPRTVEAYQQSEMEGADRGSEQVPSTWLKK